MTRRPALARVMDWLADHTGWSTTIIVVTVGVYVAVFAMALAAR